MTLVLQILPLDTSLDSMHHEMESVIYGHHVYKSVWSPVKGEQFILEKEPANPLDEFVVAVIQNSHILKNYSQVTWYFIIQRAVIYHTAGRRGKGKGLEISCKYIHFYGSTEDLVFIRDLAFIYCFHPATKWHQTFIWDQP